MGFDMRATYLVCPCSEVNDLAYGVRRGQDAISYKDQTAVFYDDILTYLQTRFPAAVDPRFPPSPLPSTTSSGSIDWQHTWPSHIVVFEDLLSSSVAGVLHKQQYHQVHSIWNSHLQDDDRRRGRIIVLEWQGDV